MKCIFYDFRRAITGRWFLVAFFASVVSLYMSIGDQSYYLMNMLSEMEMYEDSFWLDAASLLLQGMQGDFGVMILPALSALPFAAQALQEIKSGAIRPAVFRVGRKSWIAGKLLSTFASGMLLQIAAAIGLLLVFHLMMLVEAGELFPMGDFAPVWAVLLRRMFCGGIWAGVGCLIALMTETTSAAYLAPLCLCYAMVMIGTRFFPEAILLNPSNWLTGAFWPLLLVLIMLTTALVWMLRKKVNAYV